MIGPVGAVAALNEHCCAVGLLTLWSSSGCDRLWTVNELGQGNADLILAFADCVCFSHDGQRRAINLMTNTMKNRKNI